MKEQEARELVVSTGVELLEEGLLVRTWGNISCRVDQDHMVITPSGRDYRTTEPGDLPLVDLTNGEWIGEYKPSSEKGIHGAAYRIFPEAKFVIHTHQAYASAIAVYGLVGLDITPEEHEKLGDLGQADYGLPGTKKLMKAVESAMKVGCHTILMEKHGALIVGASREEAVERARLLEEICRRSCRGVGSDSEAYCVVSGRREKMEGYLKPLLPHFAFVTDAATVLQAAEGKAIQAQLDDMAQMIGSKVPVARRASETLDALKKYHAVLIPGLGGVVSGQDADDTEALVALLSKAAITARHVEACGRSDRLSAADCAIMHTVYQKKYSKKKYENVIGGE